MNRYSVVVPVFHEAENIGPFCRALVSELPPGYELLVCYDVPDDNTLPALAALPAEAKPERVRLIHNTLGKGVRYAIEAGMRAAEAPVVLVSMVDLSDDYNIVDEMVARAEAGAAVVCASRYMPGGRQIGGPWLKGLLSRTAGVSLHWLAGLPTRDPTNSFKAYRRDFLGRTPIESTAGFSLALELTVKAHFAGERVEEIPATWRDRTAGESRFRLAAWLPKYLYWYLWALRRRWLGAHGGDRGRLRAGAAMRVAWRVLRSEGLLAVRDRTLDRLTEARRRRSFSPAPPGWRPEPVSVLQVSATPPAPRLGGVQAHLRGRLRSGSALLYPEPGGWRLEVQGRSLTFPGAPPSPVALEDAAFEEAVRSAAGLLGAGSLHVEGLAGLPLRSLFRFPDLNLALHDFAAFCPRPHLLERPQLRFCWYSRDLARCGSCLRQDWPVEDTFQAERRAVAAELLANASALIFPSEFLQRTYAELFPGLPSERQRIVPPTEGIAPLPPREPGPVRHVALVGGVQAHKGALVFEEVVRRMQGQGLRWSAYGGGDPELLARLRRLPVRVRGYYRSGTLPRLLRRDGVDLALLLSTVPESYNLVLDECLAAGVPVVAFDLGAVGERLRAGRLVPLEEGAEGIARRIRP